MPTVPGADSRAVTVDAGRPEAGVLREIFYDQFADIRREEWPRALLMSAFFFLVIATFWVLKPLKRGLVLNHFGEHPLQLFGMSLPGAETEQVGKVLNVFVVFLVLMLFTWLARRFARHHLIAVLAAVFGAAFVFYASLMDAPGGVTALSFYVFGDMYNTAFVVAFWAFTNDIMAPDQAKRTYGIVGLGGILGGLAGASLVSAGVTDLGRAPLLLAALVPLGLMVAIAFAVQALVEEDGDGARPAAGGGRRVSLALEGAKLVFASRYLLAIAALVLVYELVSNIVDFQLAATIERLVEQGLERDAYFALVGQITNMASVGVQLFLTSFVMKRFGLKVALAFLPVAIFVTSAGFLVIPGLVFIVAASVADNSLNYSINQSAKEALYTPTDPNAKYKAKAFIDMFVQRFGKLVSVGINLGFAALVVGRVRLLSIVVLGLVVGWFLLVRFLGEGFRKRADAEERPLAAA